jgi:hypothetical protein
MMVVGRSAGGRQGRAWFRRSEFSSFSLARLTTVISLRGFWRGVLGGAILACFAVLFCAT